MPYKGYAFESPPRPIPHLRGSAAAAAADVKQKAENEQNLNQAWRCASLRVVVSPSTLEP